MRELTEKEDSILLEAQGLVYGDRHESYGNPYDDYTRVTNIFRAWTGITLTPEQAVKFMICVKLSREQHKSKRDNLVDACGYLQCLYRVLKRDRDLCP